MLHNSEKDFINKFNAFLEGGVDLGAMTITNFELQNESQIMSIYE